MRSTEPTLRVRRNANASAEFDKALDEIEANLPMIEAAVDVGGICVDQPLGFDRLGEPYQQLHCEAGGLSMLPVEQIVIEGRQGRRHWKRR